MPAKDDVRVTSNQMYVVTSVQSAHSRASRPYQARRQLAGNLGVRRIRAGAGMRGYSRYADTLAPEEYLMKVVNGQIPDPTLSFQLGQSFKILSLVPQYLEDDHETLGYAALIEWLNPVVATQAHKRAHDEAFERNVIKPFYQRQGAY